MAQIPPKSAVVDLKTGTVTPEWLSWLQSVADPTAVAGGTPPGTGGPAGPSRPGIGSGDNVSIVNNYGEGSPGKITKWLAVTTLGNSIMSEAGGTVTVSGSLAATVMLSAPILQGSLDVKYLGGAIPYAFLLTDVNAKPKFSQDVPFHLYPSANETWDIGRFDRLWRNGWISKINAVVFALTTQTLFGGYSSIVKNAGTFKAAVTKDDNTIDFGTLMPIWEFVLVRAHDAGGIITPEYIQVGPLHSGTRYYVYRDLLGVSNPDPSWVAGTPWMLLGTTGDGRIDFFAYDGKPKMLYNVQTSVPQQFNTRAIVGNLYGYFGYVTDAFGACFGDPNGAWVKIDDIAGSTGGVRLGYGGSTTVRISSAGASSFEAGITLGPTGALYGGAASALDTGIGMFLTGAGNTAFRFGDPNGNRVRWDGTNLLLKSAFVTIDQAGIRIGPMSGALGANYAYSFYGQGASMGGLYGSESVGASTASREIRILNDGGGDDVYPVETRVVTIGPATGGATYGRNWATITLWAFPNSHPSGLKGNMEFEANQYLFRGVYSGIGYPSPGTVTIQGDVRFNSRLIGVWGHFFTNDSNGSSVVQIDGGCAFYFRSLTGMGGAAAGATGGSFFAIPSLTHDCGNATFQWRYVYCLAVVQSSDARLKRDFAPADLGLAFLERLPVHAFRYRTDAADAPGRIGFTTQDVEVALQGRPFAAVHKHKDGNGLDYIAFVPVLTTAVQELAARVRALEDKL